MNEQDVPQTPTLWPFHSVLHRICHCGTNCLETYCLAHPNVQRIQKKLPVSIIQMNAIDMNVLGVFNFSTGKRKVNRFFFADRSRQLLFRNLLLAERYHQLLNWKKAMHPNCMSPKKYLQSKTRK